VTWTTACSRQAGGPGSAARRGQREPRLAPAAQGQQEAAAVVKGAGCDRELPHSMATATALDQREGFLDPPAVAQHSRFDLQDQVLRVSRACLSQ